MADNFDIKDFTLSSAKTIRAVDKGSGVLAAWHVTEGSVAHDSADADNPQKIGGKATSALSAATPVATGDRTDAAFDLDGALIVREGATLADGVSGNASTSGSGSTSCIAAQGAGIRTILTDITIANSSGTDITVNVLDGATVKWTFPVPSNSGVTHRWKTPLRGTANTAWSFQASAAVTTTYCSMSGYKSAV